MKKIVLLVLLAAVMLCGCSRVFDGAYSSVKPHIQPTASPDVHIISAADREQLHSVLANMVEQGQEKAMIQVADYQQELLRPDMDSVCRAIKSEHPIGAYAVDWISYEEGINEGQTAMTVHIHYIHDRTELRQIRQVADLEEATTRIQGALDRCEVGLVLRVREYEPTDLVYIVERYAMEHPEQVMETPQVSVHLYPDSGTDRVVEMRFTYQTSRGSLRSMQEQVEPVFHAAVDAAEAGQSDVERFALIHEFLMSRTEYQIATSITPPYSLLQHGVGDSRAFAQAYTRMCRMAGLEALTVSGTKDGSSHYWSIICCDGAYHHVDLLEDGFQPRGDGQMGAYVWDYSAYPVCDPMEQEVP